MALDTVPLGGQIARAARGVLSEQEGWVMGYHPVARMNPYQSLLYSRAHASNVAPVGLPHRADFEQLEIARSMGANTILHIHWTSEVLSAAEDAAETEARTAEYIETLKALREGGTRIVWSVHNVLPHRCPHPAAEANLRAQLADTVDVIHIMSSSTIEATSPHYTLPASKIIEVPHPSYVGAYPSHLDRTISRFELGYEPTDLLLGALGSIQPYKGLMQFAEATRRQIELDPDVRVLVGGIPGRDEESAQLVHDLAQANHIRLVARQLSDREMSGLVVALDAAVLPYVASLNSGAAMLALSFGIPVVAPSRYGFTDLIERGFALGYEPHGADALVEVLGKVREFREGYDRDGALKFASSIDGPTVSGEFFTKLFANLG